MSNMTALVAADAASTSALHLQCHPLTIWNTVVKKFQENWHANDCSLQFTSTSTESLVQLSIGNPMANDGDASPHHESHQLVHLAKIQWEITSFSTSFKTLVDALVQPMQLIPLEPPMVTMLTTSAPMDGYNNDPCNNNHADDDHHHHENWQSVDLLAIQQEIHQTMTSMQLLFDSLCLQPADQPNNQMVAIAWTIDPTMMTDMTDTVHQSTKPCTLGKYLTLLCTPTCFVPICMLNQTAPRPLVTPLPTRPATTSAYGRG